MWNPVRNPTKHGQSSLTPTTFQQLFSMISNNFSVPPTKIRLNAARSVAADVENHVPQIDPSEAVFVRKPARKFCGSIGSDLLYWITFSPVVVSAKVRTLFARRFAQRELMRPSGMSLYLCSVRMFFSLGESGRLCEPSRKIRLHEGSHSG